MSEPFVGEIRIFGFSWPPYDWAKCDGTLMSIAQYSTLFALIGIQFGGDGTNTFALPDLRGRAIMSPTTQYRQGFAGGVETVNLITDNLPPHTHQLNGSGEVANSDLPVGHYLSTVPQPSRGDRFMYGTAQNLVGMNSQSVTTTGGNHAHNNIQPYLAVNYCIALNGMWPDRA